MTDRLAKRTADWLFRDRSTGRYVLFSWPNVPLTAFLLARGLEWLIGPSALLHWVGTLTILWWAVDEVARGVNPFRRLLGAGVLIAVLIGTFALR